MTAEQNQEWRELTHAQRVGEAPLPEPLQAGKLSNKFRNELWLLLETDINECCGIYCDTFEPIAKGQFWEEGQFWGSCFVNYHFDILGRPHDEIPDATPEAVRQWLKKPLIEGESYEVITLLEYILRFPGIPESLVEGIEKRFEIAPYFIDRSSTPVCIFPTTSEEMKEHTQRCLDNINKSELTGAKSHFRNAARHLNENHFADTIRESIHAVESAARLIDPGASKTLGPALNSLERNGLLKHPALREAFKKLYGYTNNEQGLRHPLLEKAAANVGFDEAIFMYGASVSFVDYLISKNKAVREAHQS